MLILAIQMIYYLFKFIYPHFISHFSTSKFFSSIQVNLFKAHFKKLDFTKSRYSIHGWPGGKWSCSKPHASILEACDHSTHKLIHLDTQCLVQQAGSVRPPERQVQLGLLSDCVAAGQMVGRGHRNNCAHRFWSGICTRCFIGWEAILRRMRKHRANTGKRSREWGWIRRKKEKAQSTGDDYAGWMEMNGIQRKGKW